MWLVLLVLRLPGFFGLLPVGFASGEWLRFQLTRTVNVDSSQHGAKVVDGSLEGWIVGRQLAFRNALDDDSEELVVCEFTTFAVAEFADKSPEIHAEVPVVDQFLQKDWEVRG